MAFWESLPLRHIRKGFFPVENTTGLGFGRGRIWIRTGSGTSPSTRYVQVRSLDSTCSVVHTGMESVVLVKMTSDRGEVQDLGPHETR